MNLITAVFHFPFIIWQLWSSRSRINFKWRHVFCWKVSEGMEAGGASKSANWKIVEGRDKELLSQQCSNLNEGDGGNTLTQGAKKLQSHVSGSAKRNAQSNRFPEVTPEAAKNNRSLNLATYQAKNNIVTAADAIFIRRPFEGAGQAGGIIQVVEVSSQQQGRAVLFDVDGNGAPTRIRTFIEINGSRVF